MMSQASDASLDGGSASKAPTPAFRVNASGTLDSSTFERHARSPLVTSIAQGGSVSTPVAATRRGAPRSVDASSHASSGSEAAGDAEPVSRRRSSGRRRTVVNYADLEKSDVEDEDDNDSTGSGGASGSDDDSNGHAARDSDGGSEMPPPPARGRASTSRAATPTGRQRKRRASQRSSAKAVDDTIELLSDDSTSEASAGAGVSGECNPRGPADTLSYVNALLVIARRNTPTCSPPTQTSFHGTHCEICGVIF